MKYIKHFTSLISCPVCGAKGENINIKYLDSFLDTYMEECEVYDCICRSCGFIFQDYV